MSSSLPHFSALAEHEHYHDHAHLTSAVTAAAASPSSGSFWSLLFLCFMMFSGSFLPGYVPLWLVSAGTLSTRKIRLLNAVGAGLLISTALAVILPEGVHQLVSTPSLADESVHRHLLFQTLKTAEFNPELEASKQKFFSGDDDSANLPTNGNNVKAEDQTSRAPGYVIVHVEEGRLAYIGYTLAGGFLFMLFVEKLSSYCGGDGHGDGHGGHGHSHNQTSPSALADTELEDVDSPVSETRDHRRRDSSPNNLNRTNAASIGLIVHCAVDGIAMGSVAASHNTSQEFIVFLAILLHKAPSALGISTYLLQRRLSKKNIIRQLLVFSLSAPVSTLLTYLILTFGDSPDERLHSEDITALISQSLHLSICLLFSAGTFLYVATVHVLSEIKSASESSISWSEILAVSIGVIIPLGLGGHGHKH